METVLQYGLQKVIIATTTLLMKRIKSC